MPYFPPDRVGGVGEFSAALHAGLRARGVESEVVTRGRGPTPPGVSRIAASRLGWALACLAQVPRAARCDAAHFHAGEALPALLALRAWPGRRARIVVTFHVDNRGMAAAEAPYTLGGERLGSRPGPLQRVRNALHRLGDRAALRLADALTAVAASTARDLLGAGAERRMRVIHNGVGEPAPATGPAAAPVELFYAGVASHRKRVLALPPVLEAVRRAVPDARLRIAGFAPETAPELTERLARRGLEGAVDWVGRLTAAELPAHYRAARVAVVPSAYEGLPYAILEALREGTPVVATRVSGHPEVVRDGENGYLVPLDDPEAMAARCVALLRDPDLARRLGEAGRAHVARDFRLDATIDAYLEVYAGAPQTGA